jgi:uncharacterized protein (TIGR02145 family)
MKKLILIAAAIIGFQANATLTRADTVKYVDQNQIINLINELTTNSDSKRIIVPASPIDLPTNVIGTIVIGTQQWMDKNLDVVTYRNGDVIPQITDPYTWATCTTGAWCYYNNDAANGAIYGKLYNWYAVNDSRGLAPHGWHIPTDAEWETLSTFLGGDAAAGGKMKITGTIRWARPNQSATNESGFSGLPGGFRGVLSPDSNDGWMSADRSFDNIGFTGTWWSATEIYRESAWCRGLGFSVGDLKGGNAFKASGFSVRCIRD